jgi:2-iminoacetate synthase ThiH
MRIAPFLCSAEQCTSDPRHIQETLTKAKELKRLDLSEVGVLMAIETPEFLETFFATARFLKETIYGPLIVHFAHRYISNLCRNECIYCAFRIVVGTGINEAHQDPNLPVKLDIRRNIIK